MTEIIVSSAITVIITLVQLYIANKIIPLTKDIEVLKDDVNDIKKDITTIQDRCYNNHASPHR